MQARSLRIVIGVGPGGSLSQKSLVRALGRLWREAGHDVVTTTGTALAGDVALVHLDTTRIPAELLPAPRTSMPVLNVRATDISKRRVSRHLVGRDDAYEGPVIVKTDDNCYGLQQVPWRFRHTLDLAARAAASSRTWPWLRRLPLKSYPVLAGKASVPAWVWTRPDLVVERFLPEVEGDLFVLRTWTFFGTREYGVKVYGRHPVVKAGNFVKYEYLASVPEALRVERERLGLDFGKFDYVLHDGEPVLLDANKTPTVRGGNTPRVRHLAEGLADFVA